ncbi:MAG: PEGA domain-containing protein [Candidatus Rokuibacteriota bacterium]
MLLRLVPLLSLATLLGVGTPAVAPAADNYFMGHSVYGFSGYSQGGALYVNAFPYFAEVHLDGNLIGLANDLQASLVDTRAGLHTLSVTAPGYETTTVRVRVARDWTTRVRLHLIPTR